MSDSESTLQGGLHARAAAENYRENAANNETTTVSIYDIRTSGSLRRLVQEGYDRGTLVVRRVNNRVPEELLIYNYVGCKAVADNGSVTHTFARFINDCTEFEMRFEDKDSLVRTLYLENDNHRLEFQLWREEGITFKVSPQAIKGTVG
jgi:hypothetical protein